MIVRSCDVQGVDVAGLEQQPVLLIADHLRHPAQVRCDHRDPGGLRRVDRQRRVLVPGGRHDLRIDVGEALGDPLVGDPAREPDPGIIGGDRVQLIEVVGVTARIADHLQRGRVLSVEAPEGLEHHVHALRSIDRPDVAEAQPVGGRGVLRADRLEGGQVDAVGGDADLLRRHPVGDQHVAHDLRGREDRVDALEAAAEEIGPPEHRLDHPRVPRLLPLRREGPLRGLAIEGPPLLDLLRRVDARPALDPPALEAVGGDLVRAGAQLAAVLHEDAAHAERPEVGRGEDQRDIQLPEDVNREAAEAADMEHVDDVGTEPGGEPPDPVGDLVVSVLGPQGVSAEDPRRQVDGVHLQAAVLVLDRLQLSRAAGRIRVDGEHMDVVAAA